MVFFGGGKRLTLGGIPLHAVLWCDRTEFGLQESLNIGVGQGVRISNGAIVFPALGLELGVQKTEDCCGSQENGENGDRLHSGNA